MLSDLTHKSYTNADEARNESENVVICVVKINRNDNENAGQKEPVESQEEKVVSSNINKLERSS